MAIFGEKTHLSKPLDSGLTGELDRGAMYGDWKDLVKNL